VRRLRVPLAFAVILAVTALGASPPGCRGILGTGVDIGSPEDPVGRFAPRPTSPVQALLLLEWCWDHRRVDRYRELFTDNYRGTCLDPTEPDVTRDEELDAAQRLFVRTNLIQFDFAGALVALPDPRPGKTDPWHKQVSVITRVGVTTRAQTRWVIDDVAFYLVRGDSALIPPDLIDRGIGPDPSRWFIERWEDRGQPAPAVRPGIPGTRISWCELKRPTP
jgi:hypothetical protein